MFQEEDQDQVRRRQSERAIQLAMANRWEDAVQANRSVIKLFPNDADSYNRLGKALMELSRFPAAKKAYKRALELDGANQIAKKNLERLNVRAKVGGQTEAAQVDPSLFIEEMGKSVSTILEKTSEEGLAKLSAGDRVELRQDGNALLVESISGDVIGEIEPRLRLRLFKLMEGGNKYTAAITKLSDEECRVLIKETYRDPSQAGRPSFPTAIATETLRPYTKSSVLDYGTADDDPTRAGPGADDPAADDDEADDKDGKTDVISQGRNVSLHAAVAAEEAAQEELEE
ncbi:MAG: tetratricopeptide repeat protein [Chloroflexi bacterium]|nr:tetratricopeptide repeat protein [Chloroflexota bacterium]